MDLIQEVRMSGCKPTFSPIELGSKEKKEDSGPKIDKQQYQWLVGKLIYLSHKQPDIAFAVGVLSQATQDPTERDLIKVKRIMRYLIGTLGKGILIKKEDI